MKHMMKWLLKFFFHFKTKLDQFYQNEKFQTFQRFTEAAVCGQVIWLTMCHFGHLLNSNIYETQYKLSESSVIFLETCMNLTLCQFAVNNQD